MARQAFQARSEATAEAEEAKRDDSPAAAPETPQEKPAPKAPAKPAAEADKAPTEDPKESGRRLPFGRKKAEVAPEQPEQPAKPVGKGRPTPKRRDVEAANRRPIVVTDRKAAKKAERAARHAAIQRQQEGMARGDERYFMPRDRGKARAYVRDVIDARWNAGELMLPVAVVVLLVMLLQRLIPDVVYIVIIVTYFVLLAGLLDSILAGFLTVRKAKKKFGDQVPKWTGFYAGMRALQMRRLRQPKPRVARGQKID